MYKKFLSLFSLIILISCSSNDDGSVYPESKKINFVENIHGYEISDSYRWLEDFTSDESFNWVKCHNIFTKKYIGNNNFYIFHLFFSFINLTYDEVLQTCRSSVCIACLCIQDRSSAQVHAWL